MAVAFFNIREYFLVTPQQEKKKRKEKLKKSANASPDTGRRHCFSKGSQPNDNRYKEKGTVVKIKRTLASHQS